MKKVVPVLTAIGLILCILVGYMAYEKYSPTKEMVDLEDYYGVSGEETVLFLDNEPLDVKGVFRDGQVYLPVSWVNQNLNERFYWDTNEQLLVYVLPDSIIYVDAETKNRDGSVSLWAGPEEVYLSSELITSYTDVRISQFTDAAVKRVFIDTGWESDEWVFLEKKGAVREKGGIKSLVVTEEPEGTLVKVLDDSMENWAKVRTENGHIGYMEKRRFGEKEQITYLSTFREPEYKSISMEEKVCLVWHQVTSKEANKSIQKLLGKTKGVNVVSPTWFALTDNEGNFTSFADQSYVDYLHEQGIQVWALLDNFSKNVQSEVLLSRTSVRKKLIDGLMKEIEKYNLDGLNLDFEGIKESAGPHYVQFIREISVACREKQIVLSVDNYVPAAYNAFYNRKEQGIVADYVIVMGYDEHYAGGEAGPVASYDYVKNGIKNTLELVPKEKVINAIPFYTRVWKEGPDGTGSDALGIADAKEWVDSKKVPLYWQDEIGLYYGEIQDEGVRKEIWLEEEASLGLKMDLIREYDLAGVACWKLGFEPAEIWDIVKVNE